MKHRTPPFIVSFWGGKGGVGGVGKWARGRGEGRGAGVRLKYVGLK